MSDVKYVAYIDESGCDGLKRLKPHPKGSSEWFVISGTIVRKDNDTRMLPWVRSILTEIGQPKCRDLHFKKLNYRKKKIVSEQIADLPIRNFVVLSHKPNMVGYRNPRIMDNNPNWFYWWLTRCLLERMTDFCALMNKKEGTPDGKLQIVFSRRGGMDYSDFQAYLAWLRLQSQTTGLYLDTRTINWNVINLDEICAFDHPNRAGLQIADCIAGAFWKGLERNSDGNCFPEFATSLKPRMFSKKGVYLGHGVKPMPGIKNMGLEENQLSLFRNYGFKGKKW